MRAQMNGHTAVDCQAPTRDRIIGIGVVSREKVNLGKSLIYEMIRDGRFPSPVQLSKGRVGWRESEIDRWIAARPAVDLRRVRSSEF